jgi:hypothetical protein
MDTTVETMAPKGIARPELVVKEVDQNTRGLTVPLLVVGCRNVSFVHPR